MEETDVRPAIFTLCGILAGICLHAHVDMWATLFGLPCLLCLASWKAEKYLA